MNTRLKLSSVPVLTRDEVIALLNTPNPTLERLRQSMYNFRHQPKTPFQRVVEMSNAFYKFAGNVSDIDWSVIKDQIKNVQDELNELNEAIDSQDLPKVRDGMADIQVFTQQAQHMLGVDGDADMHDVIDGVMTRFVKDETDLKATVAKHYAKGVSKVYLEGDFPRMVVKSAEDQPDAPKGKFLKSASYRDTVFRDPPLRVVDMATDPIVGNRLMEHTFAPDPVEFGNITALAG